MWQLTTGACYSVAYLLHCLCNHLTLGSHLDIVRCDDVLLLFLLLLLLLLLLLRLHALLFCTVTHYCSAHVTTTPRGRH